MQKCPICENTSSRKIGIKDGFRILRCVKCKSLYVVDEITAGRAPSSMTVIKTMNGILDITRMGDSIKFWAIK